MAKTATKKAKRKYNFNFRDKRVRIKKETIDQWKLKTREHGDKGKLSKFTKIPYSYLRDIFSDRKATEKQIKAINLYMRKHGRK